MSPATGSPRRSAITRGWPRVAPPLAPTPLLLAPPHEHQRSLLFGYCCYSRLPLTATYLLPRDTCHGRTTVTQPVVCTCERAWVPTPMGL